MASGRDREALIRSGKEHLWLLGGKDESFYDGEAAVITAGDGSYIIDIDERRYLESIGCSAALTVGYNNAEIIEAMVEQMRKLTTNPSRWPATLPAIELAEKIASLSPGSLSRTIFSCNGTDANETAVKIARQYWKNVGVSTKYKVIGRYRSYHGISLGMLGAGGIIPRRVSFEPLPPGFIHMKAHYCYRCPYDKTYPQCNVWCAQELRYILEAEDPSTVACYISEQTVGGGGVLPPVPEYFKIIRDICDQYGILMIVDEVITGFGRVGTWFECEKYGAVPDMMCLAKAMTGGYAALSAVHVKKEIAETFSGSPERLFQHTYTFGGMPVACAAGVANIRLLERENIIAEVPKKSAFVVGEMERIQASSAIVGDVRAHGLLIGVELVKNRATREPFRGAELTAAADTIAQVGKKNGVILMANPWMGTLIVMMAPSLNISYDELSIICSALEKGIQEVERTVAGGTV